MSIPVLLHPFKHIRNIRLSVCFPLPEIEIHIKPLIILLKIRQRHIHNMLPDSSVSSMPVLEMISSLQSFFTVLLVFFCLTARRRIDLFQLSYCKRSLLRIFSLIIFRKIRQFRLADPKFRNDQPHLITPIAKMNISQHLMPHLSCNPLDTFTDDGRTEMPDMKRFRYIRTAVVYDDCPGFFRRLKPKILIRTHLVQIICHIFFPQLQINEPRFHYTDVLKAGAVSKLRRHILSDHERRLFISLRSR